MRHPASLAGTLPQPMISVWSKYHERGGGDWQPIVPPLRRLNRSYSLAKVGAEYLCTEVLTGWMAAARTDKPTAGSDPCRSPSMDRPMHKADAWCHALAPLS